MMAQPLKVLTPCGAPCIVSPGGVCPEDSDPTVADMRDTQIMGQEADFGLSNSSHLTSSPRSPPSHAVPSSTLNIFVAATNPPKQAAYELQVRPSPRSHPEQRQLQPQTQPQLQPELHREQPRLLVHAALDNLQGAGTGTTHIGRCACHPPVVGSVRDPSQNATPGSSETTAKQSSSVVVTVAATSVTAALVALVALCVPYLSRPVLLLSSGLHAAIEQLPSRLLLVFGLAIALVIMGFLGFSCTLRALCDALSWRPQRLLRPIACNLSVSLTEPTSWVSTECHLQQDERRQMRQSPGLPVPIRKQAQQVQLPLPSHEYGHQSTQEDGLPTIVPAMTAETAPTDDVVAVLAATAVAPPAAGAPVEMAGQDANLSVVWSPFTTSAAVPSHPSLSDYFQTSVFSGASTAAGAHSSYSNSSDHSSGRSLRPASLFRAIQGWCGGICSRSRPPSLNSWAGGSCARNEGGNCVVATAVHASVSCVQAAATTNTACSAATLGGSHAVEDDSRDDRTRISDARELPLAGATGPELPAVRLDTDASGTAAAPSGCHEAGASARGDGFALRFSHGEVKGSNVLPLVSALSYAGRLCRDALPGLHLLSRSNHQGAILTQAEVAAAGSTAAARGCSGSQVDNGSTQSASAALASSGGSPTCIPSPHRQGQAPERSSYLQGVIKVASWVATSASAVCFSVLGAAMPSPARGMLPPLASGGSSGSGSRVHSRGFGSANARSQRWNSCSPVINMVSDFLPRVAGGWTASRCASNTSLTALLETDTGCGNAGACGDGGGGGAVAVGMKAVDANGSNGSGEASTAPPGGGRGGAVWDPQTTNGAHAFLLSSADAAARKPAFSDLPQNAGRVQVLSVDDEPVNQQVMRALLWGAEYEVLEARSGEDALEIIQSCEVLPDLVLLDVTLGGAVSGFEVCLEIRREYSPGELPVIMITCSSLEEDVIRGLAVGANDYLIKPLRNLELMARIKTQLALKRSIRVAAEARVNRSLLGSILPSNVIRQLKQGVTLIAQFHQEVTILFSDIRGFTNLATEWPTEQIILMLNNMFTVFDRLCDRLGVYKVETIGDAYMIVSGHDGVEDHAARMLRMATHMLAEVSEMRGYDGRPLQIRVGIHTGPAHSGVVGLSRPRYCFFGDTVNTASRMESTGFPMAVQVSESTMRAVMVCPEWASEFQFASCGPRDIKGKGIMHTFLLRVGLYDQALAELAASSAARAPVVTPKRRETVAITAAEPLAEAESNNVGDVGDAPDIDVGEAQPIPDDAAVIADRGGRHVSKPASAYSGSRSSASKAWLGQDRHQVALIEAPATADPVPDLVDHVKYASYRYHHHQMSGVDVVSSAGTNILMDNGLAVILPSHILDGSLLGSLDIVPSAPGRFGAMSASNCGGIVYRAPHGSSGSIAFASGQQTPLSLTRHLAAPAGVGTPKGSGLLPPHGGVSTGTGGLTAAPSPAGSTRPSFETSGRGVWVTSVAAASASASEAGREGVSASTNRLQGRLRGLPHNRHGASTAAVDTIASTRTFSSEVSECLEEPSLQYAVCRGATASSVGGDVCAPQTAATGARLMSNLANPTSMFQAQEPASSLGNTMQLLRSHLRTSAELTAAADAEVAGPASNMSGDEGLAATAAAKAAGLPQALEFESLVALHDLLDDPCAAVGDDSGGNTVDGALTEPTPGWSVLVEALDATGAAMHSSRGFTSTPDFANTLGNWIQVGYAGADGRAALPTAVALVASSSKHQLGHTTAGSADANVALALEPTLAVAAEALAAAVDSALNSDTGELVIESGGGGFSLSCRGTGTQAGGPRGALLAKLSSAPLPPSGAKATSPSRNAVQPHEATYETSVAIPSGNGNGGALKPQRGPSSPMLVGRPQRGPSSPMLVGRPQRGPSSPMLVGRPQRTTSNGGMARHLSMAQRMSYERVPMALNASGLESGGTGVSASALGSGSGGRGGGSIESPLDATHQRHSGVPTSAVIATSAGSGGCGVQGSASFNRSNFEGSHHSREAGSKDAGLRPPFMGKRPATATGTIPVSVSPNAVQLTREGMATAVRSGGGGSGASAMTAALENGSAWTLVAATVQRSGLYGSGSAAGAITRKRPATAHGAVIVGAALGKGRDQGLEREPSAPAGGMLHSQKSTSAIPQSRPDEVSLGTPFSGGDEYRGWVSMGPGLARLDSGTSSRGTTMTGFTNRVNSRKSFTCARPGGGGVGGRNSLGNVNGGVGGAMLTSAGSMGGVSIISQGWSNLYDPMCPRPRLTDHYHTSGDLEDFGSAGSRTPGSLQSPSFCSAQPWDISARQSPTLLIPAHSNNAAAAAAASAVAGGGGGGGIEGRGCTGSDPNAASAATMGVVRPQSPSLPPRGSSGAARAGTVSGSAANGIAAAVSGTARLPSSSAGTIAADIRGSVADPAGAFDPMFGEISGVNSVHDVVYGMGDVSGDGGEADAEDSVPSQLPLPLLRRWRSSANTRSQCQVPTQLQHPPLQQALAPTLKQNNQSQQYGGSGGNKSPAEPAGGWLLAADGLEPSDAVLLLDPTRSGGSRGPFNTVDKPRGGLEDLPMVQRAVLGRSRSMDVGQRKSLGDSACGTVYGNMNGCLPPYGTRASGTDPSLMSAGMWPASRREVAAATSSPPLKAQKPSGSYHVREYYRTKVPTVENGVAVLTTSPEGRAHAASQGNCQRSGEHCLSYAPSGGGMTSAAVAAAGSAGGLNSTDASLLVLLTAGNGSSGSLPGTGVNLGDGRVLSRGPRNSPRQLSPVSSACSPQSLTVSGAAEISPYGVEATGLKNLSALHTRRRSVDAVRRPPPLMENGTVGAPAIGPGVGSPASAFSRAFNQVPDSFQATGAASSVQRCRMSADLPRRPPGGFGSPIGGLAVTVAPPLPVCAVGSAAGAAGNGSGGLDIALMLARASELVAVPSGCKSGGCDDAEQSLSPVHPSGSGLAQQQILSDVPQPLSPRACVYSGTVDMSGPGTATKMDAAATSASGIAVVAEDLAAVSLGTAGVTTPTGMVYMLSTSDYHQPYHHHPPHHQAITYSINPPVHATRLDPVEEGCGSSTTLTMEASSTSVAGGSVQNAFAIAGTANPNANAIVAPPRPGGGVSTAADGNGSRCTGDDTPPLLPITSDGPSLPTITAGGQRHSAEHRQLSLMPGVNLTLAAAAGVFLSNSGGGYRGHRSASLTSTSSRASAVASPPHIRTVSAMSDPFVAAIVAGVRGIGGAEVATAPTSKPKAAKRAIKMILRKLKNVLRPGALGASTGSGTGSGDGLY